MHNVAILVEKLPVILATLFIVPETVFLTILPVPSRTPNAPSRGPPDLKPSFGFSYKS